MTETVVHVTTLEQWKSVLDVWFKQGHRWLVGKTGYYEIYFTQDNSRYLDLDKGLITRCYSGSNQTPTHFIEYSEFMAQQKENNKMATYYVTEEQLDLIQKLKNLPAPLVAIMNKKYGIEALYNELPLTDIEWFNYLSGVNQIELKVRETLYRLWRIDGNGNKVYMRFTSAGTPDWTTLQKNVFIAPLEEIKKWQTPAWSLEKVD